jgi:hypothetical protein
VALDAVGLIGAVFLAELHTVACEALRPIEPNPLVCRYRSMGVVATRTRHCITRLLLAPALRQLFELARRSPPGFSVVGEDVVPYIIGEIVTRPVLIEVLTWPLDGRIAFQMTLHADLVAALG